MANRRDTVPAWLVERLAANDLPPATAARVRNRLEAAHEIDRLESLAASNRATLAVHPVAQVAAEVRRRLAAPRAEDRAATRASRRLLLLPASAVTAAAGLALVVAILRPDAPPSRAGLAAPPRESTAVERTTIKGLEPHLVVYKKTAGGAVRLGSASTVRGGDTLQVAYVSAGRRYGVLASVDAEGTVATHLSDGAGKAALLVPRGETALPYALEVDDTPGFERFIFVAADTPFSTSIVVDALRPGGSPLPDDLAHYELHFTKEIP